MPESVREFLWLAAALNVIAVLRYIAGRKALTVPALPVSRAFTPVEKLEQPIDQAILAELKAIRLEKKKQTQILVYIAKQQRGKR